MNISNLIPRTSQNVEVRYIPEEEWYRLTESGMKMVMAFSVMAN